MHSEKSVQRLFELHRARREKISERERCGNCTGIGWVIKKHVLTSRVTFDECKQCDTTGVFNAVLVSKVRDVVGYHMPREKATVRLLADLDLMEREKSADRSAVGAFIAIARAWSRTNELLIQPLAELQLLLDTNGECP
ncbi:MAG: hypothetical protein AAB590_02530 [Patescibacteria group bacterium]